MSGEKSSRAGTFIAGSWGERSDLVVADSIVGPVTHTPGGPPRWRPGVSRGIFFASKGERVREFDAHPHFGSGRIVFRAVEDPALVEQVRASAARVEEARAALTQALADHQTTLGSVLARCKPAKITKPAP